MMPVKVFLKDMQDFERMNQAYVEMMGDHRPARTVTWRNCPEPPSKSSPFH